MPLHDEHGHLVGALGVNIDTTALVGAGAVLAELSGLGATSGPEATATFPGDLDQLINYVLAAAQHDPAASLSGLRRSERRELLRSTRAAAPSRSGVFLRALPPGSGSHGPPSTATSAHWKDGQDERERAAGDHTAD
jgi:predicted transcriptional regulator YheO